MSRNSPSKSKVVIGLVLVLIIFTPIVCLHGFAEPSKAEYNNESTREDLLQTDLASSEFGCPRNASAAQPCRKSYDSRSSSYDEFASDERGLGWSKEKEKIRPEDRVKSERAKALGLPTHLDWRDSGGTDWMTPIRNQGGCGSCVAFGTIGSFEAALRIRSNDPDWNVDLSEQHLFSCGGGSCSIGWYISAALNYLRDYGAPAESCYPYQALDLPCSSSCPDWQTQALKVSGWNWISNDINSIQTALQSGPVVGAFDVYRDFYSYSGGIYQHTSGDLLGGHCITIVGYDNDQSYWICKNSWGSWWGENGYFRIAFGECGIEDYVTEISLLDSETITVTSSPQGAGFVNVDGSAITTPRTFAWTAGSTHTLEAQSPVNGYSGTQYLFSSWSDGGAQTHNYIVPDSAQTVSATYLARYQLTVSVSPSGSGSTTPTVGSYWHDPGSVCSVTVTSSSEYDFYHWDLDGQNIGADPFCAFSMYSPHALTALFYRITGIPLPSSSLASNPLGRVFFIFDGKKYYVTSSAAFSSYGLSWAEVKPYTVLNPDNYQSSQISYDYLLDGKMPLPNCPYISGDINDGSLYFVPYYTWNGEKYPISGAGYNGYGGYLKTLPIRYGDPAMSLPTSPTVLDGFNPIPSASPPNHVIGRNPLDRVFFIFNDQKYHFTDWNVYLGYGFKDADINPSVNPDNYPSAQVSFDYLLEETSSIFRKPLPNQPYIVGDVNDGSLYWVPYYTWTGYKYSITSDGYNAYGGQLRNMHTRYGDPSINLQTSTYVIDGAKQLPATS